VAPPPLRQPGRRDWIVILTTPPMPLTLDVLQLWEGEMLSVERRWRHGCRFLGWMTGCTSTAPTGCPEGPEDGAAVADQRSQRELVMASLLRRPAIERRGIVHGRASAR
jgi:hypothetical protein